MRRSRLEGYRADIDGLRAIAVLAVVFYHLDFPPFTGGFVGVDVFFVISGFLIGRIVIERVRADRFTFRWFYERRARALAAPLLVVVACTYAFGNFLLLPADLVNLSDSIAAAMLFWANQHFYATLDYFKTETSQPLLHLWSLAVEEQFYLLFPIIVAVCLRRLKSLALLPLLAMTSLGASALIVYIDQSAAFYMLPFRAWELLLGCLVFLLAEMKAAPPRYIISGIGVLGLVSIVLSILLLDQHSRFPGLAALPATLGSAFVIYSGAMGGSPATRLLAWQPLPIVGEWSYSIYLWHWPLVAFGRYYLDRDFTGLEAIAVLVATFALAVPTWAVGERIRDRRPLVGSLETVTATVLVAAVIGLLAYRGSAADGFPDRLTLRAATFAAAREDWTSDQVGCVDRSPDQLRKGESCKFGRDGSQTHILLWGDSHSTALLPPFQRIAEIENITLTFIGTNGCPPILGVETVKGICAATNAATADLISLGEFDTVVLAAAWTSYGRSNVAYIDGAAVSASNPLLVTKLRETITLVRESGSTPVLIGQVPSYEADVPGFLAKRDHLSGLDHLLGYRRTIMQENTKTGPFDLVAKEINAVVVRPSEYLCADTCQLERDGVSLYKDSGHLSATGALSLTTFLQQSLNLTASAQQ